MKKLLIAAILITTSIAAAGCGEKKNASAESDMSRPAVSYSQESTENSVQNQEQIQIEEQNSASQPGVQNEALAGVQTPEQNRSNISDVK